MTRNGQGKGVDRFVKDRKRLTVGPERSGRLQVTVWNEGLAEQNNKVIADLYPRGMHGAIADGLREELGSSVSVRTATLLDQEHGLPAGVLDSTDVLTWWGHEAHAKVDEDVVSRVHQRVLDGMGLVVLHSGHMSKPFRRLMGTHCSLRWRESGDREVVWTVAPAHPIAAGLPAGFVIPREEMYGEFFDIPPPDELVFISSFTGGEVFRSGCCWTRGKGRVFYFRPGHETFPVYHQREVRRVLANAVRWAGSASRSPIDTSDSSEAPVGWYER